MRKLILVLVASLTLLQGCAKNLVVDTKGRSGTFDKSRADELTDDRIICKKIVDENVNLLIDNGKWFFAKYMEYGTVGLIKAPERKSTKINRNCLTKRGHAVLN